MRTLKRQSGTTLLVAMIMLVLITLLVINTVNLGSGSVQTVTNMQAKNQATAAAEETLQEVISTKRFFETPSTVFSEPCAGSYNKKCINLDGDSTPDIVVSLVRDPTCVKATVMSTQRLDMTNPEDANCATQEDQRLFGQGGSPGNSSCAESVWDVQAQAIDMVTQARSTAIQGISVIVPTDAIDTSCPL